MPTPKTSNSSSSRPGFYRQKTRSIIALASDLVDRFGGEVPTRHG